MRSKLCCTQMVVSKKGGGVQTDTHKGTRVVNLPGNTGKYREIGKQLPMGIQLLVANIMAWCLNQS